MPKQPDFIGFPEAIASALPVARDNHISERFMPRNAQVVRLDRQADAPPRRVPRRSATCEARASSSPWTSDARAWLKELQLYQR